MAYIPVCTIIAGAGSATLQTAVGNTNTAVATAVTAALAAANYIDQSCKTVPMNVVFDGTLYVYSVAVTSVKSA